MIKQHFWELMVSERNTTVDGKELYDHLPAWDKIVPPYFRTIAMREKGDKEGQWHFHQILMVDKKDYFNRIKKTTFRSQIQKEFGKSGTKFDWKLREVRLTLPEFFTYIFKGSDIIYKRNFPDDLFEKYKGRYQPKTRQSCKKVTRDLESYIKRCEQCIEWEIPYCKDDCAKAVVDYYDETDRVYDEYRMKNLVKTLYYKRNREEFLIKLSDF